MKGGNTDHNRLKRIYERHILKPVVNPVALVSGQGVYVQDNRGNKYLDFTTGGGVSILGYNTGPAREVQQAAIDQIRELPHLPHYIYYSERAAALAEKLASLAPGGLRKMFFCNSGSEAVEGALRAVRKATGKFEVLALQQGFMGRTMGAVSLTGVAADKMGIGPVLPGIHHAPAPYCFRCSLKQTYPGCDLACVDYLEDYLRFGTCGQVGAFVLEPILGDCGVIVPPPGYFKRVREFCARHGIALVIDETLTGMGRTGRFFAAEHSGLSPAIVIMGKALGGGLPLGAFIVDDKVAESFAYEDFSSTAGGNPAACAAGLKTIEIIQREGLVQKAAEMGGILKDRLLEMGKGAESIGQVRGLGLFMGVEIVDPETGDPSPHRAHRLKAALVEAGVLLDVFGPSSLRLSPPLIIESGDIDRFVRLFGEAVNKCV